MSIRELNGRGSPAESDLVADPILAREPGRRAGYAANLMKLDLEQRLRSLLPAEQFDRAGAECGQAFVRVLYLQRGRVDELIAAAVKDGAPGVRSVISTLVHDQREEAARAVDLVKFTPLATSTEEGAIKVSSGDFEFPMPRQACR
jgi:hypothetical protein